MTTVAPAVDEAPKRRRRLLPDLGADPATPLYILFGLNLVDELDRIAFANLSPEIADTLGVSETAIVAVGSLSAVFILVGALPLGYLGDRFPRTRIAGIAALVWGSMAVVTGLAWVLPLLFVARLGSGVARTSNEVIHPSLLADYYRPNVLPQAFRVHRAASPLGYGAAIGIGALATWAGWRLTFILLAIPTFVLLLALRSLHEPPRTRSVELRVDDEPEAPPMSFGEARRSLFAVRTLRRCWLGGFLLGVALIANAQLLSLFFKNVHGFDPFQRGIVQFTVGLGTIVGIVLGGRAAGRAAAAGSYTRLPYVVAASFLSTAVALIGMSLLPWAVAGVGCVFILGIGLGVYQPAYFPLVARIVHPRIKTQAYGWTLVFAGLGAILAIPLARFGENNSYRGAFALLAGLITIGAAVVASSSSRVQADMDRADSLEL